MKLSIFTVLLVSLNACQGNDSVNLSKQSEKSENSKKVDISATTIAILDKHLELKDFLQKVIGKDISPLLKNLKNAQNDDEKKQVLEKLKQEINTKDNNGNAPLYLVIQEQNEKMLDLLIKAGADVNAEDKNNRTPLKDAASINNVKLVEILLNAPNIDINKYNILHWAVEKGDTKIVKMLIDKGAKLDSIDKNGDTYLHLAVLKKHEDVLNQLIRTNIININSKNNAGQTPLHLARNSKLVTILINAGANIEAINKFGETPLALAIKYKEKEIENILNIQSTKLGAQDNKGRVDKKDEKLKIFMSTPFTYSFAVPTINMSTTKQYDGYAPQAPFIADYDGHGVRSYMAIKFDNSSFNTNLPEKIKEELKNKNIEEDNIDIFLVIQGLSQISEKTQIKAHGWADPDAPYTSNGPYDRVKRNFLYGIYEADQDISNEVKLNELKPFEVNTHLNRDKATGPWQIVYSPPAGAIIEISDNNRNDMAFYSLVIDNNNPNKIKAAVTLHWLLVKEILFQKEIYKNLTKEKYNSPAGKESERRIIKEYKNIGELIKFWQEESFLKDTSLVKKLAALIK